MKRTGLLLVILLIAVLFLPGCQGMITARASESSTLSDTSGPQTGETADLSDDGGNPLPPLEEPLPPPAEYTIKFVVDNPKALLSVDNMPLSSHTVKLTEGKHLLEVSGDKIKQKTLEFCVTKDDTYRLKTDPPASMVSHLRTVSVGSLPKGMEFTLDGKFLFVALLGIPAIEVIDGETLEVIQRIRPQEKPYNKGEFVEIAISPREDAILASQMSTASIHRIPLTVDEDNDFKITSSVSSQGTWSKVVAFSKSGNLFAVSNWSSYDISLFTYPEMTFLKKIPVKGIPRGMVFADNDTTLYVSNYSNGALHKIDLEKAKVVDTIYPPGKKTGALRHLVLDQEKNILYASDMQFESINVYDLNEMKLFKQIRVDYNPNTIALSPDNRYLYVSCRGPNAASTYLDRSPRAGRLYIIDCSTLEVVDTRILGNQPTALAVHPSGEYLGVSNFRDNNIEFYKIEAPAN